MDRNELREFQSPISRIIIEGLAFIASVITLYTFFTNIIGKSAVNLWIAFFLGTIIADMIHVTFNIIKNITTSPKVALLHSSFESLVQVNPVKTELNDDSVILSQLNFELFKLWDRSLADWEGAKNKQEAKFRKFIKRLKDSAEIHYFGHATVPLAIHLGHLFSIRYQIQVYHHQKNKVVNPWKWTQKKRPKGWKLNIQAPDDVPDEIDQITILVEQSFPITNEQVSSSINNLVKIRISVPSPSDQDLKAEQQAIDVASSVRNMIDKYQYAKFIHLLCAVPSPTSFLIGQIISQKVHPKIILYDFDKNLEPPYIKVMTLN